MDKLMQRVYDVVSYKKNFRMLKIKTQVLDGQRRLISEENDGKNEIRQWIADADEIFDTATDILKAGNNRAAKKCLFNSCPSPKSLGKTGKMTRDMNKTLREGLNLSSYILGLSYCKNLQSRENLLCDILEASMHTYIKVIGIYGMIGVGKTVLVRELARRARSDNLFDSIVMVHDSDSLNVKLIQTQIANQMGLQLSDADDEERRAMFLHNMLVDRFEESGHGNSTIVIQKNKILVIFDGMQRVIDLVKVGIPYGQEQNSRCKVVLISRSVDVCRKMGAEKNFLVECMDLDEAKILFRERLGDKIKSNNTMLESERYQYVENATLVKCGGLPLMINSLSCALRSMRWYDWEIIADKMGRLPLLEVAEVQNVARAILDLCNDFVQNEKKRKLFLLCCLIHQGEDVALEKLMRYGIGLSLFDDDSLVSVMDQINSWVDELKSLSLLVESKEPQHVMVHGIVQDVATSSLSEGDDILHVLLDASTCRYTRESYENCIAISVMPNGNDKCLNGLKLDKLQALLLKHRLRLSLPDNYFQGMQNLRILDIYGTTFVELPSSIGNLESLVTLHLECCKIKCLSSISKLTKLEVLSLRGSSVEDSPVEIGNLINLRVLDLTRWKKGFFLHLDVDDDVDVDVLVRLVQLRELYVRGRSLFWTEFTKLNSSLDLEVLEIDIAPRQLSPGALHYSCLRRFIICIEDNPSLEEFNSFSHVLVFNGNGSFQLEESGLIHLLQWTEMLQIKEASGLWNGVSNLSIHGFSQLKKMYIESCSEMECIVDAHKLSMSQTDIFPELQILTLKGLPKLAKICCWQPSCSSFSKLRELELQDLGKLYPHVLPIQLATQLRYLKMINCIRLQFIFPASDVDGTDKIVKLPCLEKLELGELKWLRCIQDPSDVSITLAGVLFNGKIEFPSLKDMCLVNLDRIKKLWDKEPYGIDPCFRSLKSIKISRCETLKCLFSTSIVDSLLQLEELEVIGCHQLKEVITSHAEDDASSSRMKTFPKLQTLKLQNLSYLQYFYRGSFLLQFQALRVLTLDSLGQMKTFIDPVNANTQSIQTEGTFFTEEVSFPSLEHLQVSNMNVELIQGHQDIKTFPNLSSLTLKRLRHLKSTPDIKSKKLRVICLEDIHCIRVPSSIWPINMPPILAHNLEELTLSDSVYQKEQEDKYNLIDTELLSSLRNLKLMDLKGLKNIQWNVLRNIRSLIIHDLKSLTSLISSSLLLGGNVLHHLEYVDVEKCKIIQVIISEELPVDEDFVKYGVTLFPSLKRIRLVSLSNLGFFSHGRYEALFRSLETVEILDCDCFRSFSLGPIRTPRLKSLEFCGKTVQTNIFDDLNVILKELVAAERRSRRLRDQAEYEAK